MKKTLQNFANLIQWSLETFPHLPWRQERSLYRTLISELMLQQTTVEAVKPRFEDFCRKYPDWESARHLTLPQLLEEWRGLGYYQRVRALHQLFQTYPHISAFEDDLRSLKKQPGIGPYTQGALFSIGLNEPSVALDANIRRVFERYTQSSEYSTLYHDLLAEFEPRALNESLMDLGRILCQARSAKCSQCFLRETCMSADQPLIQKTPSLEKKQRKSIHLIRLIIQNQNGEILGRYKNARQWLSGFIELPTYVRITSPHQTHQYPSEASMTQWLQKQSFECIGREFHTITTHDLESELIVVKTADCEELIALTGDHLDFYSLHSLWSSHSLVIFKKIF